MLSKAAIDTLPRTAVWNAKYVFVIGLVWIGAFSIGLALVETP